jgi:hypothetical protein
LPVIGAGANTWTGFPLAHASEVRLTESGYLVSCCTDVSEKCSFNPLALPQS